MADAKISALTNLTAADPTNDMIPIVDVSDTPPASGNTKRISINNILSSSPTASGALTVTGLVTAGSATITGDLTVATDRLKVVTGSTAVQIGATTQTQVGTTAWPSTVLGKSNARFLVGNEGIVINWNESAPVIGNYSSIFAGAKTGIGATTIGGLQIRAGIENASNQDGFCSFWTSNQAAGGYVKRYEIDSTGISTWSVAGTTAMTLNSTGLGIGDAPATNSRLTIGSTNATGFQYALRTTGITTGRSQIYLNNTSGDFIAGIESSVAGSSITGTAAYSSYVGTSTANPFYIVTNGSVKATVDSSGNVGIGVTPSVKLDVLSAAAEGTIRLTSTIDGSNASPKASSLSLRSGTSSVETARIASFNRFANVGGGDLVFSTADTSAVLQTRATIDSSGNLLVGLTVDSYTPAKGVSMFSGNSSRVAVGHANGTSSGDYYHSFAYNSTLIGSISQNGTTGVLYNTSSDYRLKESVKPISGGLARVNALKPSVYNWKSDGSTGEGFLAHELAEVVPFAVSGEKDAVNADGTIKSQGIDMSRIVPILVAAIQELTAEVNALKNA